MINLTVAQPDDRLKLSFVRDRAAMDVDLIVEAAASPAGPWEVAAVSQAGGQFLPQTGYLIEEDRVDGRVVIADKEVVFNPVLMRRFLRLTATLRE